MASIRERTTKQGETTYAVLYRHHGKQASITFQSLKGDAGAERFKALVELLGPDKALAEMAAPDQGITVDELAAEFFAWKAGDVTERTMADYRRDYANWIAPTLGRRPADSVDEMDVQRLVDAMAKTLEPKSVADRHMLLHSMFKFGSAKTRRLVDHNPCLETTLPKRRKKPPKGATLAEWQALHEAALQVDPAAADLMYFIASTGWRWSEAAALTVAGVEEYPDHDGRMALYVSVQRVFRKDANQRQVVAEDQAKSDAGIRRVKVPGSAADMIRRRIVGKGPGDLVFTNSSGRKWYQQNFLNRVWPRIVAASGVDRPVTPHWLRHTHVALLNRSGVTMPEIQRRLGHEDISTTFNTYGGMIDDISSTQLDALDHLLTGQVVKGEVVTGEVWAGEVLELDG